MLDRRTDLRVDKIECDAPSLRYFEFDHGARIECQVDSPCSWCSLTDEDRKAEEEKLSQEREDYRQKILEHRIGILNSLKVDGLDAHNRSIDLVVSTFTEIFNSDPDQLNSVTKFPCAGQKHALFVPHHGQKGKVGTPIDVSADSSGYSPHPDCEDLLFSLTGKESGLRYSIELRFYSERAKLLAGKMTELMEANNFYQEPQPIAGSGNSFIIAANDYTPLRHFVEALELMSFRVFVQGKDGERDYICIDPKQGISIWPGDQIVSLMMSLRNDLSTSLEPSMYTLRNQMLEGCALMPFLRGNCQISIHRLHAYFIAFKRMSNSNSHSSSVDSYKLLEELQGLFSDPDYPTNANQLASLMVQMDDEDDDTAFEEWMLQEYGETEDE